MNISNSLTMLKALSDSSRIRIINSLLEKPQFVEEIAERLNLAASTVSFHLKKLESAHLISKKKEQYYAIYEVNEGIFNSKLKELIIFENFEKEIQDERIKKYEQKIIKVYFKSGKLIKIPSQHKKRIIILEEIAKNFTTGVQYPESEVNLIISSFYDDYVTIRRYLVDINILSRKNGIYQLTRDFNQQKPVIKLPMTSKTNIKEINEKKKAELKKIYKLTPTPIGIFQIRCLKNNRVYIGSALNLNGKMNSHRAQLRFGTSANTRLQEDWNNFGEENFLFEILEEIKPDPNPNYEYNDDLKNLKDAWINILKAEKKEVFILGY
jgi:predicted transcriptional regulator